LKQLLIEKGRRMGRKVSGKEERKIKNRKGKKGGIYPFINLF
jgi:hypothetical protein